VLVLASVQSGRASEIAFRSMQRSAIRSSSNLMYCILRSLEGFNFQWSKAPAERVLYGFTYFSLRAKHSEK
ncbi:MAG: hypothetical protein ACHQ1H_10860, partial [Nitrososphaerales archaeon]